MPNANKKIGLALGGGTVRGMAHIGVIEELVRNQVPIDILVGCSSGSVIAAAFACGRLDELKKIGLNFQKKDRGRILDFCLTGKGIIRGRKIRSFFSFLTAGRKFEDIKSMKLAFIASDIVKNKTVILDRGSIAEALEKTTAVPGLTPVKRHNGSIVIDGGVNLLVPAKIAYELGADKVIAVDVSSNRTKMTLQMSRLRKYLREGKLGQISGPLLKASSAIQTRLAEKKLKNMVNVMRRIKLLDDYERHDFNLIEIFLMSVRAVTRNPDQGIFHDEDCDVAIHPEVLHVKRSDVSKVEDLILAGEKAAKRQMPDILKII